MDSKAVDKIIFVENQATEKTDSAYQEAELILAKANIKAKEMMVQADLEAEAEANRLLQKTKAEIVAIMEKNEKASSEDASDIRSKAEMKKEKAIRLVIERIIAKH